MRGHLRAFRALLRVYPPWFREAHGEEMEFVFRSRLERTSGVREVARLWTTTLKDAASAAPGLHRTGAPPTTTGTGGGGGMDGLIQDLRYAVRQLVRTPVFTLGAVALVAVGIGVNTTVFSVVDALLFRPPPWDRPEEVVHVYQDSDDGEPNSTSFPAYRDMVGSDVFRAVAATSPNSAVWETEEGPRPLAIEYTTASYMEVLGLSPSRGRWFEPVHDEPGAAPVAVLTHDAWVSTFGSDPDVIGSTLRLNGQPVTVIGVGPEGVVGSFAPLRSDVWLSISATVVGGTFQVANLERRQDHWYDVRARLAPGATVEQAQAAMDGLASRLATDFPELNEGRDITVFASTDIRIHPDADGDLRAMSAMLGVVVLTVLLLATANLANLLLVRGLGRSGEMAVRRALGAGRGRVGRLYLIESLILAGLGGAAGLLLARWGIGRVPTLPIDLPLGAGLAVELDVRVVAAALGLVMLTGLLFGLAPALESGRTDVSRSLRDDRRTSTGSRASRRIRKALVVIQVAASLVLVAGTGLLARSVAALQRVDTGVEADRVAWLETNLRSPGFQAEETGVVLDELMDRVRALPGVSSAAAALSLPGRVGSSTTTEVEGYVPPAGTGAVELRLGIVSGGYFEVLGIPLLEGRLFDDSDAPGDVASLVINQAAADRFYNGQDPIGRRMRGQGSEEWNRVVIGVVGNAPVSDLQATDEPMIYYSAEQTGMVPDILVVRTTSDPTSLLAPVRHLLPEVRSTLRVDAMGTLTGHFERLTAAPRLGTTLMGGFSALALVLAALGIYAVVSFGVTRRSAELGIRVALGADRGRVVRMVVREVSGTVLLGLVAGGALLALAAPALAGTLYGVSGLDPVAVGGAVVLHLAVAAAAAWLPARRAAGVDPVEALRSS